MKFLLCVLAVVSVVACQSSTSSSSSSRPVSAAVQAAYPDIDFRGVDLMRLTVEDVRQITELAHGRPEIKEPIYAIQLTGPRLAEVRSGHPEGGNGTLTEFKASGERNFWRIVDGSVHQAK